MPVLDALPRASYSSLLSAHAHPHGMALVAHGFGVTLVPESVTRAIALRNTVYRPLSDAPHAQIDLSCIYRADDGSPQLHALLALIRVQRATRSAARPDAAATCQPLGH